MVYFKLNQKAYICFLLLVCTIQIRYQTCNQRTSVFWGPISLNLDFIDQLEIIILILTVRSTRLLFKYCVVVQWIKAN